MAHAGLNVIAGGAKSAYDLLRVADRSGGIGERPVTMLGSGRERGAWFVGVAAQRHDVINPVERDRIYTFGVLLGYIDTGFVHHSDGERMKRFRLCSRAVDFVSIGSQLAREAFRHLAAARVGHAEK